MAKRGQASEEVRKYLQEHPDSGPKEVAHKLKRFGVTANLVSNIKSRLRSRGVSTGRRGSPNKLDADTLLSAARFLAMCRSLAAAHEALTLAAEIAASVKHTGRKKSRGRHVKHAAVASAESDE